MEYKTEECCPFCEVELQIHDYFNGKIYDYDEGKAMLSRVWFH